MKFIADKIDFADKLAAASRLAANRSVNGNLSGVLVELEGNRIVFTGYDMDAGIRLTSETDGITDGKIVIADPKLTAELARKMPADITIEDARGQGRSEGTLQLCFTSGNSESYYPAIAANGYPKMPPNTKGELVAVKKGVLKTMLSAVTYAAGNDKQNEFNVVRFMIDGKHFSVASSDGIRLAVAKTTLDLPQSEDGVTENSEKIKTEKSVPLKAVNELIKQIAADKENDETPVFINICKTIAYLKIGGAEIFTRLIDSKFLNVNRHISFTPEKSVKFDREKLLSLLEREIPLIPEKLRSPVIIEFNSQPTENTLEIIFSVRTEKGSAKEVIVTDFINGDIFSDAEEKEKFKIAFNPNYIYEALRSLSCEFIQFNFQRNTMPAIITPITDEKNTSEFNFIHLVTPVRS